MPVIRITDSQGETVYEGEGEIVQHGQDFALVQNRRTENGNILSRRFELSRAMAEVPFQVSQSVRARMLDPSDWIENPPQPLWVEPPGLEWNISFGEGAEGFAQYVAQMLSQPVVTAEEHRRLGEMRAQAYRTLDPDCIAEALGAGALQQAEADRLRVMYLAWGSALPDTGMQLGDLLGRPVEADLDTNEELIRSTRSEFLDDPHHYDHPNTNEMRWCPPPEGEVIPSCPA